MINFSEMEQKWQKAWADSKIFEVEPNDKPSFMVFAAFPYVNTPLHIGHLRTYAIADTLARYERMRGYNVLFAMGFHATGTPVLAFAKRIKNNDMEIIDELKMFHIPEEEIAKMVDPEYITDYFSKTGEESFRISGLSIDFRRKFISIEPFFSKFVEWQFGKLNEQNLLVKGRHPVGWCPNENNPVGMHDTKHDVEPEIEEETAIAFKVEGEDAYLLCTTYRPETVFGVTNLFVNRDSSYVLCTIDDSQKKYYISKESSSILSYQFKINVIKEVSGKELIDKTCINPVNNSKVPVYHGFFVKPSTGTGVVMSVPAHAPFDYVALERLKKEGIPVPVPIPVLKLNATQNQSQLKEIKEDIPLAKAYLDLLGVSDDASEEAIESVTKLEYKEESRYGVMIVKGYENMPEPEARERIREKLLSDGNAIKVYLLANAPVYCRCGAEIVVKIVDDQWFLNYGDEAWKAKVREHLKSMRLVPEKTRSEFEYTVEWLSLRAVARAQGLGTRFPLDQRYIIESLSDSTIYPAFYTISHILRNVEVEKLRPEFFDYVFLGKGDIDSVSKSTGIDYDVIKRCRESFDYWYRNTSNHSGSDLVQNHLTMYIFNHVAIFPKEYWPKQIVTNGMLLNEGEKMSKSLGNIVPLKDGISQYGVDPLRIYSVANADIYSDEDFSVSAVKGIQERLDYIYNACMNLDSLGSGELKPIDYWLYSKLSKKIESATKSMDDLSYRSAYQSILYDSILELKRYFARGGNNAIVVKDFLTSVVLMLQPVAPHFAEEAWHLLGNNTFASMEKWPESKKDLINEKLEKLEEAIDSTIEDAKMVIGLMERKGKKVSKVGIIIASKWKYDLYNKLAEYKDQSKVLAELGKEVSSEVASKYLSQLSKGHTELSKLESGEEDEFEEFTDAAKYISSILGKEVIIEKEENSKSERASRAMPLKPSLDLS